VDYISVRVWLLSKF